MREALRISANRATVELGTRVGYATVIGAARALGIGSGIRAFPSTFLGAAEVSPLELTAAYAPFANGGAHVRPRLIARVEAPDGHVLWQAPIDRSPALDPGVAFVMASLLRTAVDGGTGRGARVQGLPAELPFLGKTGTTNDAQDVWFVGATPDLVATAWLGFDRPRPIARKAAGGRLAAPIVGRVLRDHYRRHPLPAPWAPPATVLLRDVDTTTGKLATGDCPRHHVVRDFVLASSAPGEECPAHRSALSRFFHNFFGAVFGR